MAMEDLKLKVGQTVEYDVPFSGEPPPEATWSVDGNNIYPSNRVVIKTKDEGSHIIIKDCQRSDAGAYTLKIHNDSGTDSCTANVTIVCK